MILLILAKLIKLDLCTPGMAKGTEPSGKYQNPALDHIHAPYNISSDAENALWRNEKWVMIILLFDFFANLPKMFAQFARLIIILRASS